MKIHVRNAHFLIFIHPETFSCTPLLNLWSLKLHFILRVRPEPLPHTDIHKHQCSSMPGPTLLHIEKHDTFSTQICYSKNRDKHNGQYGSKAPPTNGLPYLFLNSRKYTEYSGVKIQINSALLSSARCSNGTCV